MLGKYNTSNCVQQNTGYLQQLRFKYTTSDDDFELQNTHDLFKLWKLYGGAENGRPENGRPNGTTLQV